jgi:hypothetical protein
MIPKPTGYLKMLHQLKVIQEMLYSTMIINLDSEYIWKGINMNCSKMPYHLTGIYPEGSINNKYYVTMCCATLQF